MVGWTAVVAAMFVAVGCTAAILAGTGLSDVAGFSEEIVACIADVLVRGWNKSELVVAIHTLLWRLHDSISSIQLSWIPGHSGVPENEAADFEAREAAEGASSSRISRVGQCHKALCTQVHKHYAGRMNAMWKSLSSGEGLRDCDWYYRPSLMWTTRLTRSASSTLSQFLSNHCPCLEYLYRWSLHDEPSCSYYEAPIEDRKHILMHYPRYMH